MALPFADGAVQVTVAEAFPATALGAAGTAGRPEGTTTADGVETAPAPRAFTAATENE